MSRVITFSRTYPSYHPKAGKPTYFVEKVMNSFHVDALGQRFFIPFEEHLYDLNKDRIPYHVYMEFRDSLFGSRTDKFTPKYHTIRSVPFEDDTVDGLWLGDFEAWFPGGHSFDGQIICWNENVVC